MTVLPIARPGIVGAAVLGLGRALGEAIAVTQVIGNVSQIRATLFQPAGHPRLVDRQQLPEPPIRGSGSPRSSTSPPSCSCSRCSSTSGRGSSSAASRGSADVRRTQQPARGCAAGRTGATAAASCSAGSSRACRRLPRRSPSPCSLLVIVSVVIKAAPATQPRLLHPTRPTLAFGQTRPAAGSPTQSSARGLWSAIASAIAIPTGILVAIYPTEFAGVRSAHRDPLRAGHAHTASRRSSSASSSTACSSSADTQSGWAGALALSVVELPIVARSAQEVLVLVPARCTRRASRSGCAAGVIVLRIVLPTAAGGLLTGAVLGVARGGGRDGAAAVHRPRSSPISGSPPTRPRRCRTSQ